MRRPRLSLVPLAALCLLAIAACSQPARTAPPMPTSQAAPTTDPREVDHNAAREAVAELDLRDLPHLMRIVSGEESPTAIIYETPASIAEGVAFYASELGALGWQERAGEGYVQDHAALIVMEKSGALLTVSISDLGDSRVVQVRHYGEADVGALPLYPDAEVIFAQRPQLIYVTPAPLAQVAGFTREALARQGWLAYERPFTSYADDASIQQLSLTRDGANLSAMISVAPAQGGKTSVQYVLGLMSVALPLPSDAADLLLAPELPYASYTTGVRQQDLLALYRTGMSSLGWREEAEAAVVGADSATLLFLRGEEQATLELERGAAGRTTVLLSQPGEDVDPASAEVADLLTTPTPDQAPTPADAAAGDAIPAPADAYDVVASPGDGPYGSLRASSPSSVAALLVFYRAALPAQGWAERVDQAEGDTRRAGLVFARPGAVLRLELRQMADGATAIRAATELE
jgi:hypothetical protein